jgi:hypothetical protein
VPRIYKNIIGFTLVSATYDRIIVNKNWLLGKLLIDAKDMTTNRSAT